jgi:aminoglycoside phosphotransferase (APT) family kinase protein
VFPPIYPDEIPQEIKRKIGMIYRISSPRRQGYTSQVAIIGSERGTFVLKRSKGSRFCGWLANEVCVLDALGATSVPVPAVLGFTEEMDGEQPQAWLLMEHLKGETVRHALLHEHDLVKRAQILFAFGEVLARIHETPVPDQWIGQRKLARSDTGSGGTQPEQWGSESARRASRTAEKEQACSFPANPDPWRLHD